MKIAGIFPSLSRGTRWLIGLHLLAAVVITIQQTVGGAQTNNFTIFRQSFWNLLRDQDLYAAYPGITFDLFKYSPTSALLFAPFALPPHTVGLVLWNLANAAVLCWGIARLLPGSAAAWALAICFLEAFGAIQNNQSNGLIAGLMILAVVAAYQARPGASALAVMTGASLKVFPLSVGVFALIPSTRRRFVAWSAVLAVLFLAAPLLVTSWDTLLEQYRSWGAVEARDHAKIEMWWIGGLLELWSGRELPHLPLQLAGAAWLTASAWFARMHWSSASVRQLLTASALGFAIVFNHMSEPPTFVIGFAGVGIWWAALPRERWRDLLVLAVVVIGSLGGSDLVPRDIRQTWYHATRLKAIVMVAAWTAMQYDLWRLLRRPVPVTTETEAPAP